MWGKKIYFNCQAINVEPWLLFVFLWAYRICRLFLTESVLVFEKILGGWRQMLPRQRLRVKGTDCVPALCCQDPHCKNCTQAQWHPLNISPTFSHRLRLLISHKYTYKWFSKTVHKTNLTIHRSPDLRHKPLFLPSPTLLWLLLATKHQIQWFLNLQGKAIPSNSYWSDWH